MIDDHNRFYEWFMKENKDELTVFDIASQNGNKEIINYLFEIISKTDESILRLTEKRNSVFHNAAQHNQCYPIIFFHEKLQNYFPNHKLIDMPNENNITPLQYACIKKHKNVVDLLIDLGADINAVDSENKSVLFYAAVGGNIRIIKKLLIHGADKTIKDHENKTPYDIARERKHHEMCKLLQPKNCISRLCSFELGSIIGIRHDYSILFLYCFYYLIIYFIFELYCKNNPPKYNFIIDDQPFVEIMLIFLSLFFMSLSCVYASAFVCCFKRKKQKTKSKQDIINLISKNNNICVRCKKQMREKTIHCIVCDVCVDNWDHHCFWLNTCIDKNVKSKFNLFFVLLFCTFLFHVLFGIVLLCKVTANTKFYSEFFFGQSDKPNNWAHTLALIILIIYLILFIYPLCFSLIPFCKETLCSSHDPLYFPDATLSDLQTVLLQQSSTKSNDNYSF